MWLDFYTFYAFTYINLQVGSWGGREGGKEYDGVMTFVRKKWNTSLFPSLELAQQQQHTLCPRAWSRHAS